jgi:signal transduction histidine kinase
MALHSPRFPSRPGQGPSWNRPTFTPSEILTRIAPTSCRETAQAEHVVQFYESEPFLLDSVQRFVAEGLRSGNAAIVAATRLHLDELERRWLAEGLDIPAARERGQYVPLEAAETLAQLMADGSPQAEPFARIIGSATAAAIARYPHLVVFGEMVEVLAAQGQHSAAVRLEELWNTLQRTHSFSLLCAYPLQDFSASSHGEWFLRVCGTHSRVIPAESYVDLPGAAERLLAISSLQQKAHALKLEMLKRKRAEDALHEADRRRDEFLATLAHELRNPLAPMRNAIEIMRVADGDHGAVTAARELIERQLDQLVRLIDELIEVSRITQGRVELRKDRTDLMTIVRMALETSGPLIERQRHRLRIEPSAEPLIVDGDATRLAQVLSNLLSNSATYSKPGNFITVALSRDAGYAVMRVIDEGIGIPPDMLPRVFDMFSRPTPVFESTRGGLGIGLTLVKRLVELHGGSVEAHSDGLDQGSTFTVRIPLLERAPEEIPNLAESALHPQRVRRHRILIADDNRDAAASLALLLHLDGHIVRTADDGAEALEIGAEFYPDVVLLDLGMPRLDGYEAVQRARQEPWGRGVTFIALTGWGQPEDQRRVREAGFDHHLVKPCSPSALRTLLQGA